MITFIKKLIIVVGCVLMLNPLSSNGQNSRSPMEDMVNAIRTNRAEDMVKYFDSFVPITINNNQAMYSHNQAEVVLKDFFERNNPKDFVVMDNGSPNNSSKICNRCVYNTCRH
jgi:hypothetical protein